MKDYFDGEAYRKLCATFGGESELTYDIFLAASTDGFQAFKNNTFDVWPLLCILLNLPLSERYSVHNIMPMMFTTDGSNPADLESYITPLVREVKKSHENGGFMMKFHDGQNRCVRFHLVWVSTDLAALGKVSGITGHNGRCPCRFCDIHGIYTNHYYFPSWVWSEKGTRQVFYNVRNLPLRKESDIQDVLCRIDAASSRAEIDRIGRETGINRRSVLLSLPSMKPFKCFPIDVMHLFYNVQRDLLELYKCSEYEDEFFLSKSTVQKLDEELVTFGDGVPGQIAPRPRPLSCSSSWKASEHKNFTLLYALVLFDGYLPRMYLNGLKYFATLAEISFSKVVSADDVREASNAAVRFVEHFEDMYVRHSVSRVKLSKYTIHLLLHIAEGLIEYGPLIGASQYWVERFIGWILDRFNARYRAGTALMNSCVFIEACKMYYHNWFDQQKREDDPVLRNGGFQVLGPYSESNRTGGGVDMYRINSCIASYLVRKLSANNITLTMDTAKKIVAGIKRYRFASRMKFKSGMEMQVVSKFRSGNRNRASCYIAVEMERGEGHIDVYYGKLLNIVYFHVEDQEEDYLRGEHCVMVFAWAENLERGEQDQVFCQRAMKNASGRITVEDIFIARRLVGVVQHTVARKEQGEGSSSYRRARAGTRTYFLDPHMRRDKLLVESAVSPDGLNRVLRGRAR